MRTGNIEGQINNIWQVAYDSGDLTEALTSLTISNLDGNNDKEYELIVRHVGGSATASYMQLRINNDSTSNIYGMQTLYGQNTTEGASRFTDNKLYIGGIVGANAQNAIGFGRIHINAKSGYVRTGFIWSAENIVTTTVDAIAAIGFSWNNTVDNITSLTILANQVGGLGIGTRIILLKKVSLTVGTRTGDISVLNKITNSWQKVYSNLLGSPAASITISNLNGNLDVLYRLKMRYISTNASGFVRLDINGDTTIGNYGVQDLAGANSTLTATRYTGCGGYLAGLTVYNPDDSISIADVLLIAKSGYVRTFLNNGADAISTTTVTNKSLQCFSWNNTADNITSLVIRAGAGNLDTGTFIELEKLVLN
jgi:hypothetical protein